MQKRAHETRKRILKTAVRLFSQQGLNGTTVDEIARSAEVNKQRIYAYFGSKENLFHSALLHVFENAELFSRSTLRQAEAEPERLTRIVVQGFLKVHATDPALWRLLAWANLEGKKCAETLKQARKKENDALRILFDRNVQARIMRPVAFEVWLFTLLAVTCFRFANHLTLSYTLGWDPAAKEFENELAAELDKIFKMESTKEGTDHEN